MSVPLKTVHLKRPASREDLARLEIGTVVYLSGRVHAAREGVCKRAVEEKENVPDAIGTASFHCSPATLRRYGETTTRRTR